VAQITGPQAKQLREALRGAFTRKQFALMLSDFLDARFEDLTTDAEFPYQLQDVIDYYNLRDSVERLVRAAQADNPTNGKLREVTVTLRIGAEFTPAAYSDGELQRVIDKNLGFIDGRQFRQKWARAERQVCRIEFPPEKHRGSGFLVGSDVVITNYHVMQPIIDDPALAAQVALRFDYEDSLAGTTSTVVRLADDWRIDHSAPHPLDTNRDGFDAPAPDQLDYALLRLSEKIGDQLIPGSTTEKRGWVSQPLVPHDFAESPFLAIVQYPVNLKLSATWDNQGFLALNANGTRVRYRANTESGSSGSPCFNINWDVVALHHTGSARNDAADIAYNQGIPFAAILSLLEQRGIKDVLGK
jgi:hypothetical protein